MNHLDGNYNGWDNIETYQAALFINNIEELYLTCRTMTAAQLKRLFGNAKYFHETGQPNMTIVSLMTILQIGTLERVNWLAIENHIHNRELR